MLEYKFRFPGSIVALGFDQGKILIPDEINSKVGLKNFFGLHFEHEKQHFKEKMPRANRLSVIINVGKGCLKFLKLAISAFILCKIQCFFNAKNRMPSVAFADSALLAHESMLDEVLSHRGRVLLFFIRDIRLHFAIKGEKRVGH